MRAFQVIEFGAPLSARVLADPLPGAREVVVDVASCGLCHTDVNLQQGHLSLGGDQKMPVAMLGIQAPVTLGHEIYGHIAAFGQESGLTPAGIGRPVVVYPWIGCGHCEACLADRDNECPTPEMLGMQRPGGHGEKVVVRDQKFLVDAEGLDPHYAGIFACSGLTAYAALGKIIRREGPIGIIGMGGLGLMALAIAKGTQFGKIAAIDIDPAKLSLATTSYGADFNFDSRAKDIGDQIQRATGGLIGIVDFVGSEQTSSLALSVLRTGGTYVNVGLFGGVLQVPLASIIPRQLVLRSSYVGTPQELRDLLGHVRAGKIKPIPIQNEPIEKINDGLERLRAGQVTGRIVHAHHAQADVRVVGGETAAA
jgi:D-arabinose 1-dehydrogenase-like Zn-dependent alcohol dehydrogenase